ncbi:MAG: glutathione S-transferase family protein [Burkholderiaceae bacterium]|nr:glutathione S-transferase family protein [Burkholderiaceae bacterium]
MKLYYHPVSTTSRPIMLLAADEGIELDYRLVDLFTGAHLAPDYACINPCQQVPLLEDGEFRLSESSAILKYLAEKAGSAAYPTDLRQRARVNEMMDWFNTGLLRELGYGSVYPQTLPHHKRGDAAVQAAHLAWSGERARRWLSILDRDLIGTRTFLCGTRLTIADYLGACIVTLGDVTRLDYSPWKNVSRWIATMKARPSWDEVNEGFYTGFVQPCREMAFVGV